MVYQFFRHIGHHTLKMTDTKLLEKIPTWAQNVLAIEVLLLSLIALWAGYTLVNVYGTLSMIESDESDIDSLPAYIPVSNSDVDSEKTATTPMLQSESSSATPTGPITSRIINIINHYRSINGRFSSFRGLPAMLFGGFIIAIATNVLSIFVPVAFASLVAAILVSPLMAGWIHLIMSPTTSGLTIVPALPSFARTVRATGSVIFLNWAVREGLFFLNEAFREHVRACAMKHGNDNVEVVLSLIDSVFSVLYFVMMFPTEVLMARAMATLFPAEKSSIISFDATINGKVRENGYITICDLWRNISIKAWKRIVAFYIQIIVLVTIFFVPMVCLMCVQIVALKQLE